jgi:hypothetical protein
MMMAIGFSAMTSPTGAKRAANYRNEVLRSKAPEDRPATFSALKTRQFPPISTARANLFGDGADRSVLFRENERSFCLHGLWSEGGKYVLRRCSASRPPGRDPGGDGRYSRISILRTVIVIELVRPMPRARCRGLADSKPSRATVAVNAGGATRESFQ